MADVDVQLEMDKEDNTLDEMEDDNQNNKQKSRPKSQIVSKVDDSGRRERGRGFKSKDQEREAQERYSGKSSEFDAMVDDEGGNAGPQRSVEGWIVFASGIHEEATEDDVHDKFGEFGEVKNLQLPLDRRTGFVKGYALVEYESKDEADKAIKGLNNTKFMDNAICVDWAFSKGAGGKSRSNNNRGRGGRRNR